MPGSSLQRLAALTIPIALVGGVGANNNANSNSNTNNNNNNKGGTATLSPLMCGLLDMWTYLPRGPYSNSLLG